MNWQQHNAFQTEFKKLSRKQRDLEKSFSALKKLLAVQFATQPSQVIAPGKIHRIYSDDTGWELWKVEMFIKDLRPNQWPRVWFSVSGATITFLAIASHTSNYNNNTMDQLALSRHDDVA